MTTADRTARAAAQLHEAAREVALVAERRGHRAEPPIAGQPGVGTIVAPGLAAFTWACDYWHEAMADTPPPGGTLAEGGPAGTAEAAAIRGSREQA